MVCPGNTKSKSTTLGRAENLSTQCLSNPPAPLNVYFCIYTAVGIVQKLQDPGAQNYKSDFHFGGGLFVCFLKKS